MASELQRRERQDNSLSALSVAIEGLNLVKEVSSATSAKAIFGSVSVLLAMIRDSVSNKQDYVDLGLSCADICVALDRGMGGKGLGDISPSVREAVNQLTTIVAEIQRKVTKRGGRSHLSRLFHASDDKDKIATWRLELNRILQVFTAELVINTHVTVSGIRDDLSKIGEEGQVNSVQPSSLGELPPPPPRACFGRDELIDKVVGLAEDLSPVALIGAGGIGKTSIALTVLHHDRIKERFGDNRRFVRCDQFAASRTNFLGRLSKVIGAGVENPDDLVPLRPYLSSKEMVIVLDNAESILDPQGADGQDIYGVVKELCEFSNVCLIITSRITTIPPDCKPLTVPTLSVDAARSIFRRIYDNDERPDLLGRVLEQLDFHPLSVTLLATVARQNGWDNNRLAREWEQHRTGVLRTDHSESLAATIELSLASPMFKNLGPHARELLGVVAFFPQGVDENNLDRLFPTIPNRTTIFDKLCTLSLTYRSNGFITMLVPLRDYLRPEDPLSSPLLCTTKDRYFVWLSAAPDPAKPGFKETGWITSEDANVEHLLDVFTSLGPNVEGVWRACTDFIKHLYWHKPRKTMLGPRIEGLPDDRCFKPQCLFALARLFGSVGNYTEQKRLLNLTLRLQKEEGDDGAVAITLTDLSGANRMLDLYKEGIHRAEEALEIYERIDDKGEQGNTLIKLAWLLWRDGQFDAAEEAASRAIEILPEKGQEFRICESHRTLGKIYHSKGERERAIHHFETALRTASSFGWNDHLFWIRCSLALLFCDEDKLDLAHAHVERAKPHAVDNVFHLGRAALLQAEFCYRQRKFEDATSEASRALEILGKLGALRWVECCKTLLRDIERETRSRMGSPVCGAPSGTSENT